jgi:hypothetical protein
MKMHCGNRYSGSSKCLHEAKENEDVMSRGWALYKGDNPKWIVFLGEWKGSWKN